MYKSVNPSGGDEPVDIKAFIASESKRNVFHEEQLKKVFTLMAEDASDSLDRIKKAL